MGAAGVKEEGHYKVYIYLGCYKVDGFYAI